MIYAPIMCGEEEREDMEKEVDVDSFWIGSDFDEDFNEESGDVEDIGKAIFFLRWKNEKMLKSQE